MGASYVKVKGWGWILLGCKMAELLVTWALLSGTVYGETGTKSRCK